MVGAKRFGTQPAQRFRHSIDSHCLCMRVHYMYFQWWSFVEPHVSELFRTVQITGNGGYKTITPPVVRHNFGANVQMLMRMHASDLIRRGTYDGSTNKGEYNYSVNYFS